MAYTYRDLIRIQSTMVANGQSDADLAPRERRLVAVMLNLASNANAAVVDYPPAESVRQDVCKALGAIAWDARPLVEAVSPASADAFSNAHERAVTILRNL